MRADEQAFWLRIGARIREARKAAGMSQLDLGAALGRTRRGRGASVGIHHYEQGVNRIDAYTLRRLESVLGTELYR